MSDCTRTRAPRARRTPRVSPVWAIPRSARLLLISARIQLLRRSPMSTTRLALRVLIAGLFAGCAGNSSSTGDDDGGGGDDGDLPFTNGASTLAGSAEAGYVDGARKVA